jgi:lysophospholipase L1-like esterase
MILKKLSISLSLIFALSLPFSSCKKEDQKLTEPPASIEAFGVLESEDMGEDYIDSFIFFGESTTYHLKSRGVLSGGTATKQVWGTESGTANLDITIRELRIVYPETNELLTIAEAAAKKRPHRMLLCFGLNGAVGNIKRGAESFKHCYRLLINEILKSSPQTEIFLASAFPVAENMDMSRYTVDVDTLNLYIATINSWTRELAEEYALPFLNIAEPLTDKNGRLDKKYQVGDGHHLTADAYRLVLKYIRTHKCETCSEVV